MKLKDGHTSCVTLAEHEGKSTNETVEKGEVVVRTKKVRKWDEGSSGEVPRNEDPQD